MGTKSGPKLSLYLNGGRRDNGKSYVGIGYVGFPKFQGEIL